MASSKQYLEQESKHDMPGQTSGGDLEVAESLLEHSRGVRETHNGNGSTAADASSMELAVINEDSKVDNGISELDPGDGHIGAHEQQSDSQYAPISNPPALGQVCRSAPPPSVMVIDRFEIHRALTYT